MTRPNTRSRGQRESDLDAAATRAANKEDDRPGSRKKKKKQRKQKESKNKIEVEEKEGRDKGEKFPSQALPARMSTESIEIESLGTIAAALDYVPAMTKGASPTPGLVASAEEVEEAIAIPKSANVKRNDGCKEHKVRC